MLQIPYGVGPAGVNILGAQTTAAGVCSTFGVTPAACVPLLPRVCYTIWLCICSLIQHPFLPPSFLAPRDCGSAARLFSVLGCRCQSRQITAFSVLTYCHCVSAAKAARGNAEWQLLSVCDYNVISWCNIIHSRLLVEKRLARVMASRTGQPSSWELALHVVLSIAIGDQGASLRIACTLACTRMPRSKSALMTSHCVCLCCLVRCAPQPACCVPVTWIPADNLAIQCALRRWFCVSVHARDMPPMQLYHG